MKTEKQKELQTQFYVGFFFGLIYGIMIYKITLKIIEVWSRN
jgi:hypothetical protein